MDNLLEQLEQWNKNDEFSRCIEAIEAIPEKERGYKLTVLLGRAYSNLAVLGDHKAHGDDDEVDKELIQHSIDILETVWKQGENDPYWNARMGYAHLMADDTAAVALEYGKRWLELEPDNPEAQKLVSDCEGYLSEEPVEMYDEADWDAVEKHIEKYFGHYDYVFHESVSTGIHLDICVIPPRKDHNYYTLVTFGMGAHRMNVPEELTEKKLERAELLINLPPDWKLSEEDWQEEKWYWPIDVLKWIARIPVKDRNTWLGWGHTISSGEPFAESTKLCGAMLLNPGVFGEPSYFCTLPDGDEVNFYQLIPLYKEEMEFKLENSVDELIDKCPDEILEVINPTRLNAITDEDTIGYDLAEMDNAESHLKRIRDLHLPVDELAAYNSMAVYLRWAMERGQLLNILNPVFHKFNSIRKKKLELYPGVKETLEKIAGMGIKVVGYTDSAEENGFYRLKRLGIDDYFQSVYVSDSQFALPDYLPASEKTQIVHGKKPNPAVIHKICQQESVAIGEIVYLGDSLTKDVYMARRAGALSVLCKYSYNAKGQDELYSKLVAISHWTATDFEQEKAIKEICKAENIHPDYTIHAFDEILAIIQTLNTIPS